MRKWIVAILVVMLLLLTACGGNSSSGTDAPDNPEIAGQPETGTSEAEEADSLGQLVQSLFGKDDPQSANKAFLEYFEKPIKAQDDNGLWGYIDVKGDWVIEPKFSQAYNFSCDRAEVVDVESGMHGFIDPMGNYAVEPLYYEANAFSEGYAAVATWGDQERDIYYNWGFIDADGNAITDFIYDDVLAFHDGLAAVTEAFEYGYIDTTGKIVIPYMFTGVTNFTHDRALAACAWSEYGHLIDKEGNQLTEDCYQPFNGFHTIDSPHYTSALGMSGDDNFRAMKYEIYENGSHGSSMTLDKDGNDISIDFSDDNPASYNTEIIAYTKYNEDGYAWAAVFDSDPNYPFGELWGVIDRDLNWVLEPTYDQVYPPSRLQDNFTAHDKDTGLWGVANFETGWVIEPAFTGVREESTFAILMKGDQLFCYNKHTNSLSESSLDAATWDIRTFSGWIPYAVEIATEKKYLLTDGFEIIHGNYEEIDTSALYVGNVYEKTGFVGARDEGGHIGLIDFQGNWLIEPRFMNIT